MEKYIAYLVLIVAYIALPPVAISKSRFPNTYYPKAVREWLLMNLYGTAYVAIAAIILWALITIGGSK